MVKKKITWTVEVEEYVGEKIIKEFSTKKEAVQAEKEYKLKKEIEKLEPIFRKYFKESDRYNRYLHRCVDCGKKILEFECIWDHDRNSLGKCIYEYSGKTEKLFDGSRCEKCHAKIIRLFEKILNLTTIDDIGQIVFSNDSSLYGQDKKSILNLYKTVDFWDKNKDK